MSESPIPILDLFAGPGGLGEGFSRLRPSGKQAFRLHLSVEMDEHAHRTLTLRAFMREFEFAGRERSIQLDYAAFVQGDIAWDELMRRHPNEAKAAKEEALRATMGEPAHDAIVDARIKKILPVFKESLVSLMIGGPPCQAYSLVGRARNKGIVDYDPEQDHRHTLYEQYLRILDQVKPSIFVMENVKGILSAKLASKGGRIFDAICEDFRKRGYRLHSLGHAVAGDTFDRDLQPEDFLLRAEDYGIPQARHRVILVGLHVDFLRKIPNFKAGAWRLKSLEAVPVKTVLRGMPKLRSGVSRRGKKEHGGWEDSILSEIRTRIHAPALKRELLDAAYHLLGKGCGDDGQGGNFVHEFAAAIPDSRMEDWLANSWLGGMANHEARGHMPSDLVRYLFCAHFAKEYGRSPTLQDFPAALLPEHANASDAAAGQGVFADRFRVQVWNRPATTVTAHISKDGHYFIHPDPKQCRSLTVREAARLQTFPDDYIFQGPRTEQYRQVGNAVPPLLANQIAEVLHRMILAAHPST